MSAARNLDPFVGFRLALKLRVNRKQTAGKPVAACSVNRLSTTGRLRVYRLCSSFDLHEISFVRASEESFRTVVFHALQGEAIGCPLCRPMRRRLALPRPASVRRPAMRRSAVTCLQYVRVLDSTNNIHNTVVQLILYIIT